MERLVTPYWVLEIESDTGESIDLSILDVEYTVEETIKEIFETREDVVKITLRGTKRQVIRKVVTREGIIEEHFYDFYFENTEYEPRLDRQLFDGLITCGFDREGGLIC